MSSYAEALAAVLLAKASAAAATVGAEREAQLRQLIDKRSIRKQLLRDWDGHNHNTSHSNSHSSSHSNSYSSSHSISHSNGNSNGNSETQDKAGLKQRKKALFSQTVDELVGQRLRTATATATEVEKEEVMGQASMQEKLVWIATDLLRHSDSDHSHSNNSSHGNSHGSSHSHSNSNSKEELVDKKERKSKKKRDRVTDTDRDVDSDRGTVRAAAESVVEAVDNSDEPKKKKKAKRDGDSTEIAEQAETGTASDSQSSGSKRESKAERDRDAGVGENGAVKQYPPAPPATGDTTILLFYAYCRPLMSKAGQDQALAHCHSVLVDLGVTGRLRIGREGYNATLTGRHDAVRKFTQALRVSEPQIERLSLLIVCNLRQQ